jgi:hypothetical protein
MFPVWFFNVLIIGALVLTAGSAAGLLLLIFRDWKRGTLW